MQTQNIESLPDDPLRTAAPGCAPGEIEPPECEPLNHQAVWDELMSAVKGDHSFLGRSPSYWKGVICDKAQTLADDADRYQYDEWNIRILEMGWKS